VQITVTQEQARGRLPRPRGQLERSFIISSYCVSFETNLVRKVTNMAAGDVYRLTFQGTFFGEAIYNVLHFEEQAGTPDPLLLPQAAADILWESSTADGFQQITPETYTVPECGVQQIDPILGSLTIVSLSGIAGFQGGAGMNNVAGVVTWRTALGGRSKRGRTYVGPVAEAVYADGIIAGGSVGAWQNGVDAFIAVYGAGGSSTEWRFGVWSGTLTSFQEATAGLCRNEARSQRRRNVGIGI
jgi:hypothetical protein